MKKSSRAVALTAAFLTAGTLVLGTSSPAFADPWTGSNVYIGDIEFNLNTDGWGVSHVYGFDGSSSVGETFTHESGTLEFYDAVSDSTEDVACDTNVQAATETVDASGNITIACEPVEISNYAGIWVTPEFYFYAEGDLVRVFYTIENRGTSDITVDEIRLLDDWDDDTDTAKFTANNDASLVTDDLVVADTEMRWQVGGYTTDDSFATLETNQAIFGSAWHLAGKSAFGTTDAKMQNDMNHSSFDYVIPAGETIHVASYATYIYGGTLFPNSNSNATAQGAYDAMIAFMPIFDSFSGRLTQGLPDCIEVVNWGSTPCVTPELPNTGANSDLMWSLAVGGLALLIAGGLIVVIRRRATQ